MSSLISDPELARAFAHCESVVRERARNFWYGLRLTPEPKRSAMYAIYAWMREADDIADTPQAAIVGAKDDIDERRARLERFRVDTDRALSGEMPTAEGALAPMWKALASIAPRYALAPKDFNDMLDGQLADLGSVRLRTWNELRAQCYRVASTVGLVCIRVWGYREERAVGLAIDRGIAFQLTNMLRDVREDRDQGRIYLPEEELAREQLDVDALVEWRDPPRCERFLRGQIERAQEHYRRSAGLESLISPECAPTLWALTRIYRRLLDRIAADPRAIMGAGRVRVATWEKVWIGFRARRLAKMARRDGGRAALAMAEEIATP